MLAAVASKNGNDAMAHPQLENSLAAFALRLFARLTVSSLLCLASAICAQAQDAQPNKNESWTTTSENSVSNANPSRTMESHSKSGNRSVDKQRVEVLGPNGRYQPDSETEKETVRVNDSTTRTVVRTYIWDSNGQKKLAQQTEEESRSTADGDAQVVRTTSSSDLNGRLQVVQREVADTKKSSPDVQETKTTVYLADGNGGFTTSRQVQESQKLGADHKIEEKKTTLVPDGNGNFKVAEVQEKTIKEDGKTRTSEERVLRPDLDGRLSEFSRNVTDETENASGEKSKTVDSYSTDVPGLTGDGRLHHNQRITTVQKKDANGETVEQQIEQPNPGNPSDGQQVRGKTKYTVRYASSGTDQTKTTQTRDASGNLNVVAVETKKSDQPPPPAPQPPPQKP